MLITYFSGYLSEDLTSNKIQLIVPPQKVVIQLMREIFYALNFYDFCFYVDCDSRLKSFQQKMTKFNGGIEQN
ncbi:hypothetical protein BpHYR1_030067 [Brachionus plicatilis]|uniref:Uncharacterized protein n=1 Tax=Brachionus plicatilis TaxID=10195 RepID=A0A3M7SZ26_BRAPC|nr:hypothetical protein BpHYR1_030067 [Brachionus plicatilis]